MKTIVQAWRRRRLRAFARRFTAAIKKRRGKKVLYSAAEIEEVAVSLGVSSKEREWAYGMFAEEEASQGYLTRIGSSRTARELRVFLAGYMFGGSTSVGYEGMWNRFDDPDDAVMGGLFNSSGSSSAGYSGEADDDGSDSGSGDSPN
jgi:small ligand-binding sensory domain FIST